MRVLLAEDNARFRGVLRRLLERDPDIIVVAEAGDGVEALDRLKEREDRDDAIEPDIKVVAEAMGERRGDADPGLGCARTW